MKNLKNKLKEIPILKKTWDKFKLRIKRIQQIEAMGSIKAIKSGNLKRGTYYALNHIVNRNDYLRQLSLAHDLALANIQSKANSERVKIAFQTSFLSTWIGDEIVKLFLSDDRYDVTIVLVWQTNSSKEKELKLLYEHFSKMNVKTIFADGSVHPGDFDIVIYTSPYIEALDKWGMKDIPLSTLVCHIPYGIYIAELQNMQFNDYIHNINWRNYAASDYYIGVADKYCGIGSYGMKFSGYPKLDPVYKKGYANKNIWKCKGDINKAKKIIYAPHHSLNVIPFYSTFDQNMNFVYEYAKLHPESTSWVFKPHPLLRVNAVKSGLFESEEKFDEYIDKWRKLPNATVEEGEYLSIMASSDAMILDSVSFMAEYLYYNKPILFLTRKGEKMNEFGKQLLTVLYNCPGDDLPGVESFIENTINGNDFMKQDRELFYEKYLNYYGKNGVLASEYIYNDITASIFSNSQ